MIVTWGKCSSEIPIILGLRLRLRWDHAPLNITLWVIFADAVAYLIGCY